MIRPRSFRLALALVLAPLVAVAQERAAQGGAEIRSVSYSTGPTKTVSEIAFPVGVLFPVSPRLSLDAGAFGVSAQVTDSAGNKTTLSGLTDVLLRGIYQLKPDAAVLTVSVNLPTGQKTISANQVIVASAVASDLVPFPVVSFGSGFSVTTGVALAAPVGPWALGFAGSFRYNGSYQPLSDTGLTMKPGAETRLRFGADRIVGQGRLSLGLTYSTFANDEVGTDLRRPGARYIPQASLSLPVGTNNSLALYSWDVYRTLTDTTLSASFVNTLTAGALLNFRMGRNSFRPQLEYRASSGLTQGHLLALIARYQMALGDKLVLIPGARLDLGGLTIPPGTSSGASSSANISGFSASLSLRTSF